MVAEIEDDDALVARLRKMATGDWVRLCGIAGRRVGELERSERWRLERRVRELEGELGVMRGSGCEACERRRARVRDAVRRHRAKRRVEGGG